MTLETDLRAALHDRAAPIHASVDLLTTRYHPRVRRLRAPVVVGGGLTSVAAGLVAAGLLLTDGASNAFAGWSPHPTAASRTQIAGAESDCAGHLAFPGLPLQLTDTRGPFTFEVYSDARSSDFCITGPSFTGSSGFSSSAAVAVPADQLARMSASTATRDGQSYSWVISRAGSDVNGATLTLDDGAQVAATVQNGWAVAWWPGDHQLSSAQVTTPGGTQTQTFPQSSCGLRDCAGGPHGGEPGGGPGGVSHTEQFGSSPAPGAGGTATSSFGYSAAGTSTTE
jgi:hypothetical protein